MHRQDIQFLDIELHKIVKGLSPEITKEVFPINVKTTLKIKKVLIGRLILKISTISIIS